MKLELSDYLLASSFIKSLCHDNGVLFQNIYLEFDSPVELSQGLYVESGENCAQTTFNIIKAYVQKSERIVGKKLEGDITHLDHGNIIRAIYYGDGDESYADDNVIQRLYQNPLVWILIKDLVCPLFDCKINNMKVIYSDINHLDFTAVINKDDEDIVLVNQVGVKPVQHALIFYRALEIMDLPPIDVIEKMLNTSMYEKFRGVLDNTFEKESEADLFVDTLLFISSFSVNLPKITTSSQFWEDYSVKLAQGGIPSGPNTSTNWWYRGLIEQMLGGARDYERNSDLEKMREELWDKIEEVKKKKGKNKPVTYQEMLEISNEHKESDKSPRSTTQGQLNKIRIW